MEKTKKELAGTTGLEPATSDVTGRRSNQLNYVPAWCRVGESQNITKLYRTARVGLFLRLDRSVSFMET